MKILYLILLYNGEINGGHTYRMATVKALQNVVGKENLDIVLSELDTSDWGCNIAIRMKSYSTGMGKLKNYIEGNITQRSDRDIDEIVELINSKGYDIVLFGSSETGKLISEIKKRCNVKTMTWYHDIVADVITDRINNQMKLKDYMKLPIWIREKNAEKIDAHLTDLPIVLHQRDADLLYKYWGRRTNAFVPIALEDKYVPQEKNSKDRSVVEPLKLLFVGAYNWKVNVEAVRWFCENVMSQLENYDVVFYVAGFQMEKIVAEGWIEAYKNVVVLGTVDDLNETYRNMDVVVEPIIHGSGMKVKTAEALMHGKELIGTAEAMVGYDELSGNICNDEKEFISKIIELSENRPDRFIKSHRDAFVKNYSINGIENKLRKILENL